MAKALQVSKIERALVVSGQNGYDEISLTTPTQISELRDGKITTSIFDPRDYGIKLVEHELLQGGDKLHNLQIAKELLEGKDSPRLDLLSLNAGAALYVYGESESIYDGFKKVKEHLLSKKVAEFLKELASFSQL